MDQVGIRDLVAVRFVDGVPLVCIAELTLCDLGEAVSSLHLDRPGGVSERRGGRRGRGTAALHVGEIRRILLVVRHLGSWLPLRGARNIPRVAWRPKSPTP